MVLVDKAGMLSAATQGHQAEQGPRESREAMWMGFSLSLQLPLDT